MGGLPKLNLLEQVGGICSCIKLARCLGVPQNVAICGYHGWHGWYLSLNLNKEKNKFLFDTLK